MTLRDLCLLKSENVLSRFVVSDSVTPRSLPCQAPLSMGFSRQVYWSGLPFPPPEDLPNSGIKSSSLASTALAGGFFSDLPFECS